MSRERVDSSHGGVKIVPLHDIVLTGSREYTIRGVLVECERMTSAFALYLTMPRCRGRVRPQGKFEGGAHAFRRIAYNASCVLFQIFPGITFGSLHALPLGSNVFRCVA